MSEEMLHTLIRDGLLRQALREAEQLRAGARPLPPCSPAYRRWERRFLSDPFRLARRAARPAWRRFARAAAMILLALSLSFGALTAVCPPVRAWVQRIAVEWFGEYAAFRFLEGEQQPAGALPPLAPAWLPEGYELVEKFDPFGDSVDLEYQDEAGHSIYISYMRPDVGDFHVNSEHHSVSRVSIHGEEAYLLTAVDQGFSSHLLWMDSTQNVAFRVSAALPDADLIRIAESIS